MGKVDKPNERTELMEGIRNNNIKLKPINETKEVEPKKVILTEQRLLIDLKEVFDDQNELDLNLLEKVIIKREILII
jgi:hypothetical protein